MEITPKQEKFARLVAEGNTYAEAYRGSYSTSKYSQKSIWEASSRLMDNVKVSARVKEIQDEMLAESQVTLLEVLEKMATWIRFNLKTIFNEDGTMKELQEMTDEEASCIASFEVSEIWGGVGKDKMQIGELKKVKLIDKRAISDQFMKHFGAYISTISLDNNTLEHLEDIFGGLEK